MRFYVSKNLGNGVRVGTSFDGKGCGSCLTAPFILIGYFYYYLLVWPVKKIVELVKRKKAGDSYRAPEKSSQQDILTQYISSAEVLFYKRTWFLVMFGLIFPVVGIAFVWLVHKEWSTKKKAIATAVMAVWFVFLIGGNISDAQPAEPSPNRQLGIITNTDTYDRNTFDSTVTSATDILTTTTTATTTSSTETTTTTATTKYVVTVWIPQSGSKYHSRSSCSNMDSPREVALEDAEAWGYKPCGRCY